MTGSINSISGAGAASSIASGSSSSAQKLTDDTKKKLEELGVDTTGITTEAQGQIALLQAQQAQGGEKAHSGGGGKEAMENIKSQATALAAKVGVQVSSDEKISDIMAAIGPAIDAKVSAAGNDQTKIAEVQELQSEYDSISSSLSNMQAQHQAKQAQLTGSLEGLANYNKIRS